MSTRTRSTTTDAPANDVSTPAGFLAEYDELVQVLNGTHGWCPDGMRYPYDYANDGQGNVIRRPADRSPSEVIADEYLTDAGKAWQAGLAAEKLVSYQAAAKAAILYGIRNGNLTTEDLSLACPRLGLPVPVQTEGARFGSVSGYAYFQVGEAFTTEMHQTLRAAVSEAIETVLANFSPALSHQSNSSNYQASANTDVNRRAEAPTWTFPETDPS